MTSSELSVEINGEPRRVPEGTTVATLLDRLALSGKFVAVEVNCQLVPKARHAARRLAEGDRIEIVTLVGGG